MDARLLVATPIRGAELWSSHVTVGYSESLRLLSRTMPVEELSATVTFSCDNIRARNRIAGTVLRDFPEVTHVLWWDDDQWPEDVRIVKDMIDTGEDVIAAPYPNKRQPLRWTHTLLSPCPPPQGDLQEVKGVGFGFTITSRNCLEKMSADARTYTDHPHRFRLANIFGQVYESVDDNPDNDALLSEDYSFCQRWRQMGGRVMLYCKSGIVNHAGAHAWSAREMAGAVIG